MKYTSEVNEIKFKKIKRFGKIGTSLVVFVDKECADIIKVNEDSEYTMMVHADRIVILPGSREIRPDTPIRYMSVKKFSKINNTLVIFIDKVVQERMNIEAKQEFSLKAFSDRFEVVIDETRPENVEKINGNI